MRKLSAKPPYLVQVNSTDETIEDGLPLGILAVGSALKQARYRRNQIRSRRRSDTTSPKSFTGV